MTRPSTQQSASSGSSAPFHQSANSLTSADIDRLPNQQSSIDHVRDFYFLMTQIADYKRSRHLLSKNMRSLFEAKCNTRLRKTIPDKYKPRIELEMSAQLQLVWFEIDVMVDEEKLPISIFHRDAYGYEQFMEIDWSDPFINLLSVPGAELYVHDPRPVA